MQLQILIVGNGARAFFFDGYMKDGSISVDLQAISVSFLLNVKEGIKIGAALGPGGSISVKVEDFE